MRPASRGDVWMVGYMVCAAVWGAAGNELMCAISSGAFLVTWFLDRWQK